MNRVFAIGGAVAGVLIFTLLILLSGARGERDVARAERDTARTETIEARRAFEMEKASTAEALAAAQRLAAQAAEDYDRHNAIVARMTVQADVYRAALRSCQTPAAVAERLGNLFKESP